MRDYITALLLFAILTLFAAFHVATERQIDTLSRQVDSLRAQQVAITARQQGVWAVQTWQTGMMIQYLEMGRVNRETGDN